MNTSNIQVFLPCARGLVLDPESKRAMSAIRKFIDFTMIITQPVQNERDLGVAQKLLEEFDEEKDVFRTVANVSMDIPKLHSLSHYINQVRRYGTPDNFDTEHMEHQHISVKDGYQRTNKRDPLPQMIKYFQRRSSLQMKQEYLDYLGNRTPLPAIAHKYRMGSQLPDCPMYISSASEKYDIKGLEEAVQNFLLEQEESHELTSNQPKVT